MAAAFGGDQVAGREHSREQSSRSRASDLLVDFAGDGPRCLGHGAVVVGPTMIAWRGSVNRGAARVAANANDERRGAISSSRGCEHAWMKVGDMGLHWQDGGHNMEAGREATDHLSTSGRSSTLSRGSAIALSWR